MAGHTPGPWSLEEGRVLTEGGWLLASLPYTLGDEEDRANARLIAAAPDLLEACKALLEWRDSGAELNHLKDLSRLALVGAKVQAAVDRAERGDAADS